MGFLGHILEFLLDDFLGPVCWYVLQIVGRILATPFILILSLFGSGSYADKVKERYRKWFEWTWRIKPD